MGQQTIEGTPADLKGGSKSYLEIGRIANLRTEIDQSRTVTENFRNRMSVVDLIPCDYTLPLGTILELSSKFFTPNIKYENAINRFVQKQSAYGLDTSNVSNIATYEFLRLYVTDISSIEDQITNEYSKNIVDDTLSSIFSNKWINALTKYVRTANGTSTGSSGSFDPIKDYVKEIAPQSDKLEIIGDFLTHGSRINFPKVWNGSDYEPNMQLNVRLMSPYGHPEAVSNFIIKPLAYLLLLLSPVTNYGITTRRPNYITLKAYGLNNMWLCYPRDISIKRGGDDSSYNIYKQPLTVDVTLTFISSTQGFAIFEECADTTGATAYKNPEAYIFRSGSDISLQSFESDFTQPGCLFSTLRNIVNSLRPFGYNTTEKKSNSSGASFNSSGASFNSSGASFNSSEELNVSESINPSTINTTIVKYIDPNIEVQVPETETSPVIDLQIVSDEEEILNNTYTKDTFTPDDVITNMNIEDNTATFIVADGQITTASNGYLIRSRVFNTSLNMPGPWSDVAAISKDLNTEDIPVRSEITPTHLSFDGVRVNNMLGNSKLVSGFSPGEQTVTITDKTGVVLLEQTIDIPELSTEDINLYFPITVPVGSLKTTFVINEESYDLIDFQFYLISDFGETSFIGYCSGITLEDLPVGKYYIVVMHNDMVVPYKNTTIQNYIIVQENVKLNVILDIKNLIITGVQIQAS